MQKPLLFKTLIVGAVALLLLIPLAMIQVTVSERAYYRADAVRSVQDSYAGPQTLTTPFVVWPYTEHWELRSYNKEEKRYDVTKRSSTHQIISFADQADFSATAEVQNDRHRGLHKVRTYETAVKLQAGFTLPARKLVKPLHESGTLVWDEPYLVLGISDIRGLRGTPKLVVGDAEQAFAQGTRAVNLTGIHAPFPNRNDGDKLSIEISLNLAGMEQLSIVPTAGTTTAQLQSSWLHPSFGGRFLPMRKALSEAGFQSTWSVSSLASKVQGELPDYVLSTNQNRLPLESFSVAFVEPVNIYLLAERATKYGVLFIVLGFAALFFYEVQRKQPLHPIQYGFLGMTLAIFFLLLLSLTEHLEFWIAYVTGASACVLLIGAYLRWVLGTWKRSLAFSGALTLMYAAIFSILMAEQTSLLMGSLLLFAVLAGLMMATRKVNWYAITPVAAATKTAPGEAPGAA